MPSYYTLPDLDFGYDALAPVISTEQLTLHHQKHHNAYVTSANQALEKMDKARIEKKEIDMKAALKNLSFHISGHILHSLFWNNLAPKEKIDEPSTMLLQRLEKEFGSLQNFQSEFTQAALTAEGSGWAAAVYDPMTERILIQQIEKHNINIYPMFRILLIIDVWEHAYYLDYKNDRSAYLTNIWQIINWNEVNKRLEKALF